MGGTYRQRERVLRFAAESFGTQPEYLWADTPEAAVLRHPNSKKWYGILMRVSRERVGLRYINLISRERLGLEGPGAADVLNLKCGPLLLGSLLEEPGFLPAYHMSKTHWVSILLDGPAEARRAGLEELDNACIARNLSPGGCADLLALALLLRRTEGIWHG